MSLDYIVQVAGYNKPLKNGLTRLGYAKLASLGSLCSLLLYFSKLKYKYKYDMLLKQNHQ